MRPLLRAERLTSTVIRELLEKRWPNTKKINPELEDQVGAIIEDVKRRGDDALIEYTKKFDDVDLSLDDLCLGKEEIEAAFEKVENEQITSIEFAKQRLEASEKDLLMRSNFNNEYEGIRILSRTRPLRSVGCYVPGGKAAYPSTLIMTATPAKTAGVPRIVVCSPPKKGGEVNPLTLVAADICGVDEIYRVGGVQAIAAMAYGTEIIRPVEKLVGPGNKYVQAAKQMVSRDTPIDVHAGPSEVVVLADDSADPRIVALDLISQAEHGPDGVSMLVTTSMRLAEAVEKELKTALSGIDRTNGLENFIVLFSENIDMALAFVNEFAPEHIEVMTDDAWKIAEKITSAGLILIGKYTPVSASDYCLGTNHVLPTGGYSQVFSGLSSLNFTKRVNIVEATEDGLSKVRRCVNILAESEGLPNHARAVEGRFSDE